MSAHCRSCGAPVVWVETEAKGDKPGRKMPLDADPNNPDKALKVDNGNIINTGQRSGDGTWLVRYVGPGPNRYRSHFATCPKADKHRKAKR